MTNDEITDDTPMVGAEDELIDAPGLMIEPWPALRWVHIDGQRIAVNPKPEADLEDLAEAIRAVVGEPWEDAIPGILGAIGVPGLLAEVDRLKTEASEARVQVIVMQARIDALRTAAGLSPFDEDDDEA